MKTNIEIQTQENANTALIQVSGEVDMSTSNKLREALLNVIKKKKDTVVVNLEKINYIDSSGLATLVEGLQNTKHYKGAFKLILKNPKILDILKLARLNQIFEIFESMEAAKVNL
ncbi:MAG: STAS domain-containing protein [Candidatus Brocadiae bacterium]|nr:STAS domain-containing protein [Candidatus Brocadiia bacterium]